MAHKRAFSKTIIETDAFQDMSQTAQLLYFYLNLNADDDGFVGNPKRIMRSGGFAEDDFKVLLAKRFLLRFENGVVVIKHWLIHNTIRHDRYCETTYLKEKETLKIKENKAYTEDWQPNGNQLATQDKIREDKIKEDNKLDFSLFWTAYGKKKDKPTCESKWGKLSLDEQTAVLDYIPKYLATIKDKQYQKYPATFLNNRSWENDIDEKEIDTSGWSDMKIIEQFGVAGLKKYRGNDFKI
jgi:hypothetical protein